MAKAQQVVTIKFNHFDAIIATVKVSPKERTIEHTDFITFDYSLDYYLTDSTALAELIQQLGNELSPYLQKRAKLAVSFPQKYGISTRAVIDTDLNEEMENAFLSLIGSEMVPYDHTQYAYQLPAEYGYDSERAVSALHRSVVYLAEDLASHVNQEISYVGLHPLVLMNHVFDMGFVTPDDSFIIINHEESSLEVLLYFNGIPQTSFFLPISPENSSHLLVELRNNLELYISNNYKYNFRNIFFASNQILDQLVESIASSLRMTVKPLKQIPNIRFGKDCDEEYVQSNLNRFIGNLELARLALAEDE